ncbi:MAG: hypothetical protein WCK58_19305, partial [Chloroflexota bacterium]
TKPAGAAQITYLVKAVTVTADASGVKRPSITFKFQKDGVDVAFNTYSSPGTLQMMNGFAGSTSVYWAFAVAQDGITSPADWNTSSNCFIRDAWRGSNANCAWTVGTGADLGYYTITKRDVNLNNATLVTGGVGYSYSYSSPNQQQPITQIDLPAYPATVVAGFPMLYQGGLIVPAPNVWKTGTGFTARRSIVATDRCNDCHGFLGIAPTFHIGQRNDGPTCVFCHNANGVNNGWSYNIKDAVHSIHAAGMRNTDYTWEIGAGAKFWAVTYPGKLYNCEACHVPGYYDFSASAYLGSSSTPSVTPRMLWSTVAKGTYSGPATSFSPYVQQGVNYGTIWTFSASFGTAVEATSNTLVVSPITAACSACHDSNNAIVHMTDFGGVFYSSRGSVMATPHSSAGQEQCLICHGPNTVAEIKAVHAKPGPGVVTAKDPYRMNVRY